LLRGAGVEDREVNLVNSDVSELWDQINDFPSGSIKAVREVHRLFAPGFAG
jgi:hypothetical protein